ncbi:uncharacterized protein LOC132179721 [Corylus avellana]|uniref:uncharacterized protein LOC132179721 n=1 Tax=Corylus avellana TaxID=13451 RepID=UPI00286AACB7|nr:uncharacterized protein LOC132179721 [Corylus avellana]
MWRDPWHPFGILLEIFGQRVVYDAQSSVEAKLSFIILNGDWFWRPARSETLVEIQSGLLEVCLGLHDKPIRTASRKDCYVSSETWEILRKKKVETAWWKLAWSPIAIPKQAFILWLAMQDRLLTGDCLLKWGYKGDVKCLFYHSQTESRDHLFFECNFSYRIWKFFMFRCRVDNPFVIWDEILQLRISNWGNKALKGLICRLVLGSVIYNLWCTRNEIKHSGQPNTEEQLLKKILWEVRARIVGKEKFPKRASCLTVFVEPAYRFVVVSCFCRLCFVVCLLLGLFSVRFVYGFEGF